MITGRPGVMTIAGAQLGEPTPVTGVPLWSGVHGASPGHATYPPFQPSLHDGSSSQSHMYLHGRGFYALSPITYPTVTDDLVEANPAYDFLLANWNKKLVIAERTALLVFHTCAVHAQCVDGSSGVCC